MIASTAKARPPGRCHMKGNCGKKSVFSPELPCSIDEKASMPAEDAFRDLLVATCGSDFAEGPSQFVDVAETQEVTGSDEKPSEAVKTVEYYIDADWKQKFFDSCKNVKFGASNGFAMDFIGGGARDPNAFLKFLGDEKPLLGSPFQINFPDWHTCTALPELPATNRPGSSCSIGAMSCFTFSVIILYALLVGVVWFWKPLQKLVRGRRGVIALPHRTSGLSLFSSQSSGFERVRMDSEDSLDGVDSRQQPQSANSGGLVGARGLGHFGEESSASSAPDGTYRGIGLERNDNLSALGALQPRKYALNQLLTRSFYRLGLFCARRPWLTFMIAAVFVGIANIGWKNFEVEVDPVRLWVAPGSTAKVQKEIFDQEFGPFYRPQQIFLMDGHSYQELTALRHNSSSDALAALPPTLSWDRLLWLADLEQAVRDLETPSGVTLQDVCLAPAGPGTPCVVQSILGYFQDDPEGYGLDATNWDEVLDQCASNPAECLPLFGQPLKPNIVLGGLPDNAQPSNARSAVVTYVLNNSLNKTLLNAAEEWEQKLLELLQSVAADPTSVSQVNESADSPHPLSVRRKELGVQIAFSTGVSLETEIGSSSNTDVGIVVLSYLTMFVYVALTLGGRTSHSSELEEDLESDSPIAEPGSYPRMSAASPRAASGGFGRLLQTALRRSRSFVNAYCISSKFTLGLFGIIIVLFSVSCAVGIFSAMGVKVTLIIAEVIPFMLLAVGVDNIFLLCNEMDRQTLQQQSAAMTLDARRVESGRIDCLPCLKAPRRPAIQLPTDPVAESKEGSLDSFIRYRFAPTLLRPGVKRLVVAAFGAVAVISSIGVRRIEMGLDQRLALPSKSYLRPYFDAIDVFLDVGPPVYFVAAGKEVSEHQGQRGLCGRFTTCEPLSLANTLEGERKRPEVSWIAEPASSWIDDFLQWLNPILDGCCRVKKSDPSVFCGPRDSPFACQPCFEGRDPPWNITMDGLPEGEEFYRYLRKWLESPTDQECPLGGQAAYSSALSIATDVKTGKEYVRTSHFRTYFSPLRSQSDFISALEQSQRISNDISDRVGYRVFPYSLFFIFFEQYTYLLSMAVQVLGSAAIAIFAINTVLLGSWRTGAVVTLSVASAVFLVAGAMGFWGIQFNALTLVNLSVCAAIGVEFCAHIARAFMRAPGALPRSHPMSQKERDERAWLALTDVGGAVVNGIFSTKLIGVGVLIFTKSDLLKLYYAKTWLCLIVGGLLHGLILLPVLLSWLGGRGWSGGEDEADVKRRLVRSGSEYRPMMASEPEASDEEDDL
ncbi:hypothetical protein NDA16_001876 [Ustilago loliicola]|nr:hypothetical protein NDA16_001876 [Ustilago loliicola]